MATVKQFVLVLLPLAFFVSSSYGQDRLQETIVPILEDHCFDCHAGGGEEGGVTFDHLVDEESPSIDPKLWKRVLKQVRTGLMPPIDSEQLEQEQKDQLESWIINEAFRHDSSNPDPGSVTVRRLNRVEYRITIKDLLGVRYDTSVNFPPDDSGDGFDNVGDVLTISPMLMEKYIDAAQVIAGDAVPLVGREVPDRKFSGNDFEVDKACIDDEQNLSIPYYEAKTATLGFELNKSDKYSLTFELVNAEAYIENATDANRCQVKVILDDEVLLEKEFSRDPWKHYPFEFERTLEKGDHSIRVELTPLTEEKRGRELKIRFEDIVLRGPLSPENQIVPKKHARFFTQPIPNAEEERLKYADQLLRQFLFRAYRRTPDDETIQRLCQLAQSIWQKEEGTFEKGIRQAYVAILSSPRFLFREEFPVTADSSASVHPLVDEFSLASRLSYFLWSSMPDKELLELARKNELRKNLPDQVERMLHDSRFKNFYRNFVGQWLQTRDVSGVSINSFSVLLRESPDPHIHEKHARFRQLRKEQKRSLTPEGQKEREELLKVLRPVFSKARGLELNDRLRHAMRMETELFVAHVIDEDKDLAELIDCNYTFLNERLAKHYGVDGVEGRKMRLVELPEESIRGGLLGHGSMLAVTSNPDRTSPVKRGLFLLDNVLGMPTGAPPPDIPSLEESETGDDGKRISLREALALHRESPLCSSCHNRMDPLGLALENFDPLGRERTWREVDVSGELVTGESFEDLNELKGILATNHKESIYRCIAEKMLVYALGRSLDFYDVPTIDRVIERVQSKDGSGKEMLRAVIDSVAFQRMRYENRAELSKND